MKRCLFALLLATLLSGCVTEYYDAQGRPIPPPDAAAKARAQEEANRDTKDLSPEGLFTAGVEAIANDRYGNLYVANFTEPNSIGFIRPGEPGRILVTLNSASASGLRFNRAGEMLISDPTGRAVLKMIPATAQLAIIGHDPQMTRLNDLAVSNAGMVFASDTNWQTGSGKIWRINLDGTATLLSSLIGAANGIEISPDDKILYVNESNSRTVWAYDLDSVGNASNKRLIIRFPSGSVNGMRCDEEGNLYIARFGEGVVAIVSPDGDVKKEIRLKGKRPTNLSFGGPDGKTIYVTVQDRGCVEYFENDTPGARWGNKL